jgi:hypothetical protein
VYAFDGQAETETLLLRQQMTHNTLPVSHTLYALRRLGPWHILPVFFLAVTLGAPGLLRSQEAIPLPEEAHATSGRLYDELARMDSLLFDAGFVRCEADEVIALFSDDVEFYHDQTGLRSGDEVREDFRRLTSNCPRSNGVRRLLVEGSLEAYPIHDFGAVQTGVHRFVEEGASTSTLARFVHLWQNQNGRWILTRVLSFDHRPEL